MHPVLTCRTYGLYELALIKGKISKGCVYRVARLKHFRSPGSLHPICTLPTWLGSRCAKLIKIDSRSLSAVMAYEESTQGDKYLCNQKLFFQLNSHCVTIKNMFCMVRCIGNTYAMKYILHLNQCVFEAVHVQLFTVSIN